MITGKITFEFEVIGTEELSPFSDEKMPPGKGIVTVEYEAEDNGVPSIYRVNANGVNGSGQLLINSGTSEENALLRVIGSLGLLGVMAQVSGRKDTN